MGRKNKKRRDRVPGSQAPSHARIDRAGLSGKSKRGSAELNELTEADVDIAISGDPRTPPTTLRGFPEERAASTRAINEAFAEAIERGPAYRDYSAGGKSMASRAVTRRTAQGGTLAFDDAARIDGEPEPSGKTDRTTGRTYGPDDDVPSPGSITEAWEPTQGGKTRRGGLEVMVDSAQGKAYGDTPEVRAVADAAMADPNRIAVEAWGDPKGKSRPQPTNAIGGESVEQWRGKSATEQHDDPRAVPADYQSGRIIEEWPGDAPQGKTERPNSRYMDAPYGGPGNDPRDVAVEQWRYEDVPDPAELDPAPTGKAERPTTVHGNEIDDADVPKDRIITEWDDATKRPPVADRIYPFWRHRPRTLPDVRDNTLREWREQGGYFTLSAQVIRRINPHAHQFVPEWERETIDTAQLWFVSSDMSELVMGAARDDKLGATRLHPDLIPDDEGLVIFETPLAGIDSENPEVEIAVGAYLWGRGTWRDADTGRIMPCIAITAYGPGGDGRTIPYLLPLGGLIWPYGAPADIAWGHHNLSLAQDGNVDQVDASMIEDRRRLLALWLLSSQEGIATTTIHRNPKPVNKGKAKRLRKSGKIADPPVRVIELRHRPTGAHEAVTTGPGRKFRHRWTVSGHWRNQPYGPRDNPTYKPIYINAYLKGPEGAPLLKTERIKAWVR